MTRLRTVLVAVAVGAAVMAQAALGQETSTSTAPASSSPSTLAAPSPTAPAPAPSAPSTSTSTAPTTTAPAPSTPLGGVEQGGTITAPSTEPSSPSESGGTPAAQAPTEPEEPPAGTPAPDPVSPAPDPSSGSFFAVPPTPTAVCGGTGPPTALQPIYQAASDAYGLGAQGPAVLAAINHIETNFGQLNTVTSTAGAIGWMQFMPSTWDMYGVDADGDGSADPYNPRDAIFAAARYLKAAGMPADVYGAIFAYNHADWYVAEVLADAGCYGTFMTSPTTVPQLPVLDCTSAMKGDARIPTAYLQAFEGAAGRYELGEKGVWALAAVARLESDYGRGMNKEQLRATGPLGLDDTEWNRFGVDGDGDGFVHRSSPDDSAATLARLIWSRGDIEAGVFSHNQAQWYVDAVMAQSAQMKGSCQVTHAAWPILYPAASPGQITWSNLSFSNDLERSDVEGGQLDPRVMKLLATITKNHTITLSATRSDHSMLTASGNISNHYYGRAIDIAMVDGVSCTDVDPNAPCGQLGRMMTLLPADVHPTELIYCYDMDGPGPAFALPDHCDHIHAGFYG